jgi:hypothetical protein
LKRELKFLTRQNIWDEYLRHSGLFPKNNNNNNNQQMSHLILGKKCDNPSDPLAVYLIHKKALKTKSH